MASKHNVAQTDAKPVKVDKWDGSALKNALDDTAKQVLKEKLGYAESYGMMNGRLIICSLSVGFALFAVLWDYLYPFPLSRPILITCVALYFVMMIVLTIYVTYQERGVFMVALQKDRAGIDPDNTWNLASRMNRFDDVYELFISFTDGRTGNHREASVSKSVAEFFDDNGYLCSDIFEADVLKLHSSLVATKKTN